MLLLTFRAAEDLYAVDVGRVAEVLPRVHLRRLPHSPGYLAGVFDYRGIVVPVIDLGILLGDESCRDRLSTRIIVVDVRPPEAGAGPSPGVADGSEPGDAEADEPAGESPGRPDASSRRWLAGIVAEQVSDVVKVRPEQVISRPMALPQAPYLGVIVEINQEMIQLIVADQLLDRSFRSTFFGADAGPEATAAERRAVSGS